MNAWFSPGTRVSVYRAGLRCLIALTIVVPVVSTIWLWHGYSQRMRLQRATPGSLQVARPVRFQKLSASTELPWSVLTPSRARMDLQSSSLAAKWRLAGTFFTFPEFGKSECKAILDSVADNRQVLVAEGDKLGELEIMRILADHIIVRTPNGQDVLWLSFASKHEDAQPIKEISEAAQPTEKPFEKSKFGTRMGERRWVMNRDALMGYYDELREDPERIAKLYVSMKPNYVENGRISGYRVDMVGEEEFFEAAGLKQGDIVKKVNSLEMTSKAKAEYFISEFLQGRLNAVVLDIERDNQPEKLIYLIR